MYGVECGGMGWRGTESDAERYFGDEKGQNMRNMQKYASTHFARCASLSCSLNVRSDLAMKIPSYLGWYLRVAYTVYYYTGVLRYIAST